jgi:hypothetical protein
MGKIIKFVLDKRTIEADENDTISTVMHDARVPDGSVIYEIANPTKPIDKDSMAGILADRELSYVQEAIRG